SSLYNEKIMYWYSKEYRLRVKSNC
uniref:Uncharacterized protein n=1 Tax=Amphimedon queenslandica TaxID=400682 RepID=A0A1X7TXN9_AMPQE